MKDKGNTYHFLRPAMGDGILTTSGKMKIFQEVNSITACNYKNKLNFAVKVKNGRPTELFWSQLMELKNCRRTSSKFLTSMVVYSSTKSRKKD